MNDTANMDVYVERANALVKDWPMGIVKDVLPAFLDEMSSSLRQGDRLDDVIKKCTPNFDVELRAWVLARAKYDCKGLSRTMSGAMVGEMIKPIEQTLSEFVSDLMLAIFEVVLLVLLVTGNPLAPALAVLRYGKDFFRFCFEGQKEKEARFRKDERDKIARRKWAVTTKLSGKSVESIKRKLSQLSELMRSGDVDDCDVKKVYKAVSDVVNSSKMQQSLVSALKRAAEE